VEYVDVWMDAHVHGWCVVWSNIELPQAAMINAEENLIFLSK